jgi:iron complex outermembrane receptor protein
MMRISRTVTFMSGVALSCLAASAQAQTAPATSTEPAAPAAPDATGDTGNMSLQDIIVTAERRSESLQKVPVSITAISGDQLIQQGITQPLSLVSKVPGLSISTGNGPVSIIYIRGVGTSVGNLFGDNAVAFNVDGVVLSRATGLSNQMFDVSRVEVLKGPQGTLYGRNATGGAINIITNRPTLGKFGVDAAIEVGNYGLVTGDAAVNVPLSDNAAVRLSGRLTHRDGYFTDGTEDDKSAAGRLRFLYEPSDTLSILLNGDYSHQHNKGPGAVLSPYLVPSNPWLGGSDPLEQARFSALARPLPLAPIGTDSFNKADNYGISAEINWKTGLGTFTLIPGYRYLSDSFINYNPGFLNNYVEDARQTTVEARLASSDTVRLSYILGAFYIHENRTANQYVNQTITSSRNIISDLPTDQLAAFGNLKYKLTDTLRLTGGMRYTHEVKSETGSSLNPATNVVTPFLGHLEFNNVSWKTGVEFDVAPQSLLYFNVGTGFKAGGFYSSPAPYNTFKPEKITAYTFGSKNTFLDGHLRLNLEAFYWDYKDHQESHLGYSPTGSIVYKTENVGAATMKGAEIEASVLPWKGGHFDARIQYLDAVFNNFTYTAAAPALPPQSGCALTLTAPKTYLVDCSGKSAIRAPKWSGTIGASQDFQLGSIGSLSPSVDVEFASSSYQGVDYVIGEFQPSYALVNLGLTWRDPGKKFMLSGYVRNVGDVPVITGTNQQLFAPSIVLVDLRAPRTFGARFSVSF